MQITTSFFLANCFVFRHSPSFAHRRSLAKEGNLKLP